MVRRQASLCTGTALAGGSPSRGELRLSLARAVTRRDTNCALAAPTAIVAVTSVPGGAEIEVDGQFLGNTPAELPLAAGERLVKLTKTGHQPWERKLQVLAGGKQTVMAELEVRFS